MLKFLIQKNLINFNNKGGIMKLKSETKQTIEFLHKRFDCAMQEKTLLEQCKMLNLNYDMVQRALILMHRKNLISRDSRGKGTSYTYPIKLGLGDVIDAIEGIDLNDKFITSDVLDDLNKIRI